MSKVIEGEQAVTPAATEIVPETPPLSLGERLNKATPQQLKEWEDTGKEPEIASPVKEAKPAATVTALELEKTEAPKVEPGQGPDAKVQEPKPDKSWRKDRKIGELSAENRRLARELEQLKAAGSKPPADIPAERATALANRPMPPRLPKLSAFETVELYESAVDDYEKKRDAYEERLADWKIDQREKTRQEDESRLSAEEEESELKEDFASGIEAVQTEHPDYNEVVRKFGPYLDKHAPHLADAISRLGPLGPKAVIYLGKTHVSELNRIMKLSPSLGLLELGKITGQLTKAPPQPKKHTDAPDPVKSVEGRSQVVEGPPIGSQAWEEQENARTIARRAYR